MSDSANNLLAIHESLTYSQPEKIVDGDISFVSFKPTSVGQYGPGQSVEFKLRSNNEFVILDRSYIRFTYKEIGTVFTGSTALIAPMGTAAFFQNVTDTISGLQLPMARNWNVLQAVKLNTDSAERKTITSRCQLYGNTTVVQPVTVSGAGRVAVMPIPTNLSTSNKIVPLCVLNGGWSLNYQLAPFSQVYQGVLGTSSTYVIENMEIVACVIKPVDSYLQEVSSALARGGALKIPLQLYKNVSNPLTTALTQSIRIQTGYLGSLNTITSLLRPAANVNKVATAALDSFLSNNSIIQEYYIMLNSQRYPRNRAISVTTSGAVDPENFYHTLASYNTSLSSLTTVVENTQGFCHFSLKSNQEFSSGVPTNDSFLTVELTFNTAPSAGDILETYLECDSILQISANNVSLSLDV